MSSTTFTGTDTYSVSDVKAVMQNTHEDIIGFANKGIIDYEKAKKWIDDIMYMMNEKVLKSFEIQIYNSQGVRYKAYKYTVGTFGYLSTGDQSGGINYWEIPAGSKASLFADIDYGLQNTKAVADELAKRGWGTNGTPLVGSELSERAYISNNLKLQRSQITK